LDTGMTFLALIALGVLVVLVQCPQSNQLFKLCFLRGSIEKTPDPHKSG
jgi:hypothetical protein